MEGAVVACCVVALFGRASATRAPAWAVAQRSPRASPAAAATATAAAAAAVAAMVQWQGTVVWVMCWFEIPTLFLVASKDRTEVRLETCPFAQLFQRRCRVHTHQGVAADAALRLPPASDRSRRGVDTSLGCRAVIGLPCRCSLRVGSLARLEGSAGGGQRSARAAETTETRAVGEIWPERGWTACPRAMARPPRRHAFGGSSKRCSAHSRKPTRPARLRWRS